MRTTRRNHGGAKTALGARQLAVICALAMIVGGCDEPEDRCAGVDEGNLQAILACYHPTGRTFDPNGMWRLLATEGQQDVEESEWRLHSERPPLATETVVSAYEVVSEEGGAGRRYAAVRVLYAPRSGDACSVSDTHTWRRDRGVWRRLRLVGALGLIQSTTASGDYPTAIRLAQELLVVDPLNVDAYSQIAFARHRTSDLDGAAEALRSALQIDPQNSTALFGGVAIASRARVALRFLERLGQQSCSYSGAAFNYSLNLRGVELLEFLTAANVSVDDSRFHAVRGLAYIEADDREGLETFLTATRRDAFGTHLRNYDGDPIYVAAWATYMATIVAFLESQAAARSWLDMATDLNPNDRGATDVDNWLSRSAARGDEKVRWSAVRRRVSQARAN